MTNIEEYEKFTSAAGTFTQSANWAKVKDSWGSEFITVRDKDGSVKGTMLILIKQMPVLGAFLYAPRGPICDMHDKKTLTEILEKVKEVTKKYNGFLLKIDPMIDQDDKEAIDNLKSLGFRDYPENVGYDNIQCRENYLLDIRDKTADEVFQSFKSKWRYNIRLASRRGVTCKLCREEGLDDFIILMKETAERDGFDMRGKEYFKKVLDAFGDKAYLCMCYLDETPLSGALCIEYAGVISYVYGASSSSHRECMPNYLMQWTMIQKAVEHGCHTYDFCGIPYWYDENHHNYGVYRFKSGFNGYVKTYAGEFDYPLKPLRFHAFKTAWWLKKHKPGKR